MSEYSDRKVLIEIELIANIICCLNIFVANHISEISPLNKRDRRIHDYWDIFLNH